MIPIANLFELKNPTLSQKIGKSIQGAGVGINTRSFKKFKTGIDKSMGGMQAGLNLMQKKMTGQKITRMDKLKAGKEGAISAGKGMVNVGAHLMRKKVGQKLIDVGRKAQGLPSRKELESSAIGKKTLGTRDHRLTYGPNTYAKLTAGS